MTPTRKRYSFFIDPELADGLKALKERDGMPEAEAIRRAVAEFLDRRGIKAKRPHAARKRGRTA